MPMNYLEAIEYHTFPMRVVDQQALQCLRVLLAAELVDATITASAETGLDAVAEVHGITVKGRVALAQRAQGKPFP